MTTQYLLGNSLKFERISVPAGNKIPGKSSSLPRREASEKQSGLFGSANILQWRRCKEGHRWLWTNFRRRHAHRTTRWAQNGPLPCHDKQVSGRKKKRKGKLINAAAHASFSLSKWTIPSLFSGGSGTARSVAAAAAADCFVKSTTLENRCLRSLAHMSNDIHPLKTLSPYCASWAQENKPQSKVAIYGLKIEVNVFFFNF